MTIEEIKHTLELHGQWLRGERGGVRADLSGAHLYGVNLYGANLRGANLRGAHLRGAESIMQFGPMPTSGRIVYAVRHDSGWMVQAGCFWGTVDELEAKVKASHNCPAYLGFIEILKKLCEK